MAQARVIGRVEEAFEAAFLGNDDAAQLLNDEARCTCSRARTCARTASASRGADMAKCSRRMTSWLATKFT